MPVRPLVLLPDPILRQKSKPVENLDNSLQGLIDDMFETMYEAPGIGLAAIQIGVPLRVLVVDVKQEEGQARQPLAVINPEIVWRSEEYRNCEEGCLSIPEYYAEIERPSSIKMRYLERDGRPAELDAEGMLATCLQHEVDHLNGVLFIDYLSKLKRDRVIKKFKKVQKKLDLNPQG